MSTTFTQTRPSLWLRTSPSSEERASTIAGPSSPRRCTAIIFDLGDVLFTWSASTQTSISPKLLRKIMRSSTWFEYEKGNLGEDECYVAVAHEFGLAASDVASALQAARDSLTHNPAMIELIREIRRDPTIRVFAMSNISLPDWEFLRTRGTRSDWDLFDRVFTSAEAHERKPNLGFFRRVLSETRVDPSRTVFVDDKLENVLSARSTGLNGIVYESFDGLAQQLKNLVADPIGKANQYLQANARNLLSITNTGVTLKENFAQLLILEATGDENIVDYIKYPRLFNFFRGEGILTDSTFPCDLDTTSIGLTVTRHLSESTKRSVMDEMLQHKDQDDIIQTYFDSARPRIDPVVCSNVLTLFHSNSRGSDLSSTLDWVFDVLQHRAYKDGTLYYYGADPFLFFLSRLLTVSPAVRRRFEPLFAERVLERFGVAGDALALAMRIIAAARVQCRDVVDYERLLTLQEADGSWPVGWLYKYGASDILVGNKGLTTAFAKQAIEAFLSLGN